MERLPIRIFDTTLRDGEQSPGCSMSVGEKLRLAHQLDRLGVDVIEAGFPIASDGDFEAVQAISAQVRRPIIAGLARGCDPDIDRAWQAVQRAAHPRIHVFLATSDIHLNYKLRISREECLQRAAESVRRARSYCEDVEFSPEDATRSDSEFLYEVLAAVAEAGATTLNIPDTVGYTTPAEYKELISTIVCRFGGDDVTISTHCHNDLGLAVANTLAGIEAGASQVECTINGIGERAGNAALEEIVMAMRVRTDRYAYATGVHTEQLYPTSQLLTEITGVSVQPNKAIIGRNAFAHEAGIHQDGMLKNALTYEIMTPQSAGVPDSTFVLGKHSGRHALGLRCDQLGFHFERKQLDEIYRRFIALADEIKVVEDHHLLQLIQSSGAAHMVAKAPADVPPRAAAAAASANTVRSSQTCQLSMLGTAGIGLRLARESQHEDYLWGV
ncbi:MAG: 2-isopropylmalate synthase [Acidobacteriales bacterium]|nr:2-isopropylmalate synthase [Terriglobales bacterium]